MTKRVSPDNPCPFLRALVANGFAEEGGEGLLSITAKIASTGGETKDEGKVSKKKLFVVALVANGLNPFRLLKSLFRGVDIGTLRHGSLYKKGVSSRIINPDGSINDEEFGRLDQFARDVTDPDTGGGERGLLRDQITEMLDANFARAEGKRRNIDRPLMDGEWPILLNIMGKGRGADRYLSITELHDLFYHNRFPDRILKRLEKSR